MVEDENDYYQLISMIEQVKKNVILIGYFDDITFNKYIYTVDIGINLRYPMLGASDTLIKPIEAGKSLTLSDIVPFKELPDEFYSKVSIGSSKVDEIYSYMKTLVFDSNLRSSMVITARKYAEKHLSYAQAAEKYIKFISMILNMKD